MNRTLIKLSVAASVLLALAVGVITVTGDAGSTAAQAASAKRPSKPTATSLYRVLRTAQKSSTATQAAVERANGYIEMAPQLGLDPSRTRMIADGAVQLFILTGGQNVCLQTRNTANEESGMTCDSPANLAKKDVLVMSGTDDGRIRYHALVRDGIQALDIERGSGDSQRVAVRSNAISGVLPKGVKRFEWTGVANDRRSHTPLAGQPER